jgi:hypothetical protein
MSFIAAAAAAGTTVAAMQAAAMAGLTAAQVAAATAAAAAAAEAAAVATAATAATVGAEAAIVAPIIAPVAPGGIAAMGSSSLGSLGTGIVETAGEKVLEQGAKEVAKKGIEQLGRKAAEETTKETVKRSALDVAKESNNQLLTKLPQYQPKAPPGQGIQVAEAPANIVSDASRKLTTFTDELGANAKTAQNIDTFDSARMLRMNADLAKNAKPPAIPEQPLAQPNLFSVAEQPKPIPRSVSPQAGPRTGSMGGGDTIGAQAKPVNTFDAAVKPELSPRNMSGDVGKINESLNAAAQRQASADTFGGVGTAYEPAITKTPVEKSFLDKAGEFAMNNKMELALGGLGLMQMMPPESGVNPISEDMIRPYTYSEEDTSDQEADPSGREKIRYKGSYTAGTPYKAAQGGLLSLHRGGNFLSGGGDGMSDDIPAMIGTKQPARLADGEFVIPADVVSHIGNGSSKAGAEKLYAMMDKIRQERTGRKRQSPQINAAKYLPR